MNYNPENKCLRTFGLLSIQLLSLVFSLWLQSDLFMIPNSLFHLLKILAKVFSRRALESYLPRLQEVIKSEIAKWCAEPGSVDVYAATRSLTFRIAIGVLLGLHLEEERINYLAQIFGQLMSNLFSLPIDAPFSGLRKVSVNNFTSTQQMHEQLWISFVFIQKHLLSFFGNRRMLTIGMSHEIVWQNNKHTNSVDGQCPQWKNSRLKDFLR